MPSSRFRSLDRHGSWQAAMGLVVLNGLIVLALVLAGVREAVMRAIPLDLRRAISVGIGLFIALIGAVNARLVVIPRSSLSTVNTNPLATVPPVTHGSLQAAGTVAGARRLPDHRVPAHEASARRDRHWHCGGNGRRAPARHLTLAGRRLAANAAVRHGVSSGRAIRARHPSVTAAALDRDGRFLRHYRHRHRDR